MDDATWLDATDQAALVRSGQASPLELVEQAIARIERVDPSLNAVVRDRFERARAEAAGPLPDGPLRGVPMLLKDLGCHLAGEHTDDGTSFLRSSEVTWPTDSSLALRFRAAGLVALGRTNVPELGTTVTTEPVSTGPCRNPYDPGRSVGGSSGGSAAAVAAGLVAVAHANDGGGSIRIPASACGLVGLKPTRARVSQGPEVGEAWAGATIDGVVTRSVRDTATVLDVIGRPAHGDPYWAPPLERPLLQEVGAPVGRLRVGLLEAAPAGSRALDDPECRAAVTATGHLLERLGCDVEPGHPQPMFDEPFLRLFGATIAADTAVALQHLERVLGRPIGDDELEPRNQAYRRAGDQMSARDYLSARAWLGSWARRMSLWWAPPDEGGQGFDLLVTPTVATRPPELGWMTGEDEGKRVAGFMPYTAQYNVTGQPAVSLPLHWTPEGLPVGVQLVAAFGREDLLVRVAAALEDAAPWRDRRPAVSA